MAHLSFSSLLHSAGMPEIIKVQSEELINATGSNGKGYYWDILREVYKTSNSTLEMNTSTYKRAAGLIQKKEIHIMVGAYKDEIPDVIYPSWSFDSEVVSALYIKGTIGSWQGEDSLRDKHVSWIRGYQLQNYIPKTYFAHEPYNREKVFELLASKEIDIFLDAEMDIKLEMDKQNVDPASYEISTVKELKLYFVFSNNDAGELLKEVFDKRFAELIENGRIQQLADKWDWGSVKASK